MKISYLRTGGFAGMVMAFDVNTESLPSEEAEEISQLVDTADFFALPAVIPSNEPGADQFEYTLTVETEEQAHSIQVGEAAVPEKLWPIIDKLRILSRSQRGS